MTKRDKTDFPLVLLSWASGLFVLDFAVYLYYAIFTLGWGSFAYLYVLFFAFVPGLLLYAVYLFFLARDEQGWSHLKGCERLLAGIGAAAIGWKLVGILLSILGIA